MGQSYYAGMHCLPFAKHNTLHSSQKFCFGLIHPHSSNSFLAYSQGLLWTVDWQQYSFGRTIGFSFEPCHAHHCCSLFFWWWSHEPWYFPMQERPLFCILKYRFILALQNSLQYCMALLVLFFLFQWTECQVSSLGAKIHVEYN